MKTGLGSSQRQTLDDKRRGVDSLRLLLLHRFRIWTERNLGETRAILSRWDKNRDICRGWKMKSVRKWS